MGCDISDGRLLNYDEVIVEISKDDDHVIDLRGENFDEDDRFFASDELNRKLVEIYKNNDEEAFSELLGEYPLGISDISEIANLEDRSVVDLSQYFMGDDVSYIRNYYALRRLIDMDKPVKRHVLNENAELKTRPTYSARKVKCIEG